MILFEFIFVYNLIADPYTEHGFFRGSKPPLLKF